MRTALYDSGGKLIKPTFMIGGLMPHKKATASNTSSGRITVFITPPLSPLNPNKNISRPATVFIASLLTYSSIKN
jgi:hypothetical protein